MRSTFFVCALTLAAGCSESDPETPWMPGATGDPNLGSTAGANTGASSTAGDTTGLTTSSTAGSTAGGESSTTAAQPTTTGGSTTGAGVATTAGDDAGPTTSGTTGTTGTDAGQTTAAADAGGMLDAAEPTPQTCPAAGAGSPGRTTETVQVGGVNREYILYVPDSYTGDAPVPLMVNFHPLLTNAGTAESSSGYKALADKEGFIVAFPDSQQDQAWNVGGVCCTRDPDVQDEEFARALVEQVKSNFCVDEKRVYASGFSMGAGMSHYLACEAADVFAAVATGHFDLFEENTCAPVRPITVFSFRSTSDFIVPYDGGEKTSAPNGFRGTHTFLGAKGTFERWGELNGCTGQPVARGSDCETYDQCSEGVEVTLCTVGGGHSFPDAARSWEGIKGFSLP